MKNSNRLGILVRSCRTAERRIEIRIYKHGVDSMGRGYQDRCLDVYEDHKPIKQGRPHKFRMLAIVGTLIGEGVIFVGSAFADIASPAWIKQNLKTAIKAGLSSLKDLPQGPSDKNLFRFGEGGALISKKAERQKIYKEAGVVMRNNPSPKGVAKAKVILACLN